MTRLTAKQHRNIANGIERVKLACGIANHVYHMFYPYEWSSYFSDRFKNK